MPSQDTKTPLTNQHIVWAASHDWFSSAAIPTHGTDPAYVIGTAQVLDTRTGVWSEETEKFTDFEALRAWAGY